MKLDTVKMVPGFSVLSLLTGDSKMAPLYVVEPDRTKEPVFMLPFVYTLKDQETLKSIMAEYEAGTPTLRAIYRAMYDFSGLGNGKSNMKQRLLWDALERERKNPTL